MMYKLCVCVCVCVRVMCKLCVCVCVMCKLCVCVCVTVWVGGGLASQKYVYANTVHVYLKT